MLYNFSILIIPEILKPSGTEGPLLIKYAAVLIASTQKAFGSPACNFMLLALLFKVRFISSAMPFYSGLPGTALIILISFSVQNSFNSWLSYSLPLSVLKLFILEPV
ncbi:hypothetical protein DsansV1_C06g0068281 [Dioscorea sansibarensis]